MIRKIFAAAVITAALVSCNSKQPEQNTETPATAPAAEMQYFGDTITADGAIPATELPAKLAGKDSIKVKVTGTIEEVCQKKGCWMDMKIAENQVMKVGFKDYAFFVPKDAAGKTVIIEGYAYTDTVSVAQLKHYAEDAGKTKEEIAKISAPEVSVSFEANGVIIKK